MNDNTKRLIEGEWVGMPEFVQEDKEAVKSVTVHFESLADLELFNKITGLNITIKTKGVFFPAKVTTKKVYIDEP